MLLSAISAKSKLARGILFGQILRLLSNDAFKVKTDLPH